MICFSFSFVVTAIVEQNYKAREEDDLTLEKGDIIKNIKQKADGRWEGTLTSTGKTGMFPDKFVRVINGDDKSSVVLR